jgi:thiamine pyrophosphokinase
MSTCYLVGAGDFTARDFSPKNGDFVIAADAGYLALVKLGVRPGLLVGDFDSLSDRPEGIPLRIFPVDKDDTDMGIAIAEGWARGYRDFTLYGADGGRADHTLANLQLLGGLSRRSALARMVCPRYDVFALTRGTLLLPERPAGTLVSVFCHGARARGVTLNGLKFPLDQATLTCDRPLGVSNEYVGGKASVTVGRGTLLIFTALSPQK